MRKPFPIRNLLVPALLLAACQSTSDMEVLKTWEQARWSQLYKMVDADQNGSVDRAEFQRNYVPVTWRYFDRDGDGYITSGEWVLDGTSPERDAWFRDLDASGDGRVSQQEFQSAESAENVDRYFDLMDADQDGVIERSDLAIE